MSTFFLFFEKNFATYPTLSHFIRHPLLQSQYANLTSFPKFRPFLLNWAHEVSLAQRLRGLGSFPHLAHAFSQIPLLKCPIQG